MAPECRVSIMTPSANILVFEPKNRRYGTFFTEVVNSSLYVTLLLHLQKLVSALYILVFTGPFLVGLIPCFQRWSALESSLSSSAAAVHDSGNESCTPGAIYIKSSRVQNRSPSAGAKMKLKKSKSKTSGLVDLLQFLPKMARHAFDSQRQSFDGNPRLFQNNF